MQLKAEGLKSLGNRSQKAPGLVLGVAVDNDVIGVASKGGIGMFPVHPAIERIMHEHVGQQG